MRIKSAAILHEGKIYEGPSHAEIGLKMCRDGVIPYGEMYPGGDAQGFVTECGRYVRRAPARSIAVRAGQVDPDKTCHSRLLFSEDLPK